MTKFMIIKLDIYVEVDGQIDQSDLMVIKKFSEKAILRTSTSSEFDNILKAKFDILSSSKKSTIKGYQLLNKEQAIENIRTKK